MPKRDTVRRIDLDQNFWRNAYKKIRNMMFPHHAEHEPGGKDAVSLKLNDLVDVDADGPDDDQTIAFKKSSGNWELKALADTKRIGQAFFQMVPLSVATVPGPTNLTEGPLTVRTVRISTDGLVIGSMTVTGAFNFGPGGGVALYEDLGYNWADGAGLSLSTTYIGTDGTYLSADVYFER